MYSGFVGLFLWQEALMQRGKVILNADIRVLLPLSGMILGQEAGASFSRAQDDRLLF